MKDSKKIGYNVSKVNQNSSFNLNNQSSIVSFSTNISTKFKSKYSSIGPKTETYLKSYTTSTKRNNDNSIRFDTKKIAGNTNTNITSTNKDLINIKKKKSSFEDEKKDMGSFKKINISEAKMPTIK